MPRGAFILTLPKIREIIPYTYRKVRKFGHTLNFELNYLYEINFFEGLYTVTKSRMALSTSGSNH